MGHPILQRLSHAEILWSFMSRWLILPPPYHGSAVRPNFLFNPAERHPSQMGRSSCMQKRRTRTAFFRPGSPLGIRITAFLHSASGTVSRSPAAIHPRLSVSAPSWFPPQPCIRSRPYPRPARKARFRKPLSCRAGIPEPVPAPWRGSSACRCGQRCCR